MKRALLLSFSSFAVLAPLVAGCREDTTPSPGVRRVSDRTISFPATVHPRAFDRDGATPGYHAIVWGRGGAAGASLFRAEVSDIEVLDALEELGARPGNALDLDTWERRHDSEHPAPGRRIEGPEVEILVKLPGAPEPVPLSELLEDPGGRGLDLRFGGHRANVPHWKSGCITCLYSCPGSKVGNRAYTVRDFVEGATRFRARTDRLPPEGSPVEIVFRLAGAPDGGV